MSPASRSKSKDIKIGKEQPPKGSSKPSVHVNTSTGAPASGYNPLSGTFHTFETSPVPTSSPLHSNTQFPNIDDPDDHNNAESDSVSNNGSWSGESEDHKEKILPQPAVPGADNDKREKIRLKNERKHQRQKERRAQELHERCSWYLMSRKLEALSQQFVSMGFSRERATMALILNEGRVEESVAWLFEGGEEEKLTEHNNNSNNLKIDISEELIQITEMEIKYRASKQEVERVLVSCEGNLERAEEILKAQKEEPPAVVVPSMPQEIGDPGKQPVQINQNSTSVQTKPTILQQQKREERDLNYAKPLPVDTGVKSVHALKKAQVPQLKPEWTKPPHIIIAGASVGSKPSKTEEREPPKYVNELKNLQLGSVKEPVIVMQRPQTTITPKQAPSTSLGSSPPGTNMGWYSNSVETVKPNGHVRSFDVGSNPMYNQLHYQSQKQHPQYVSSSRGASSPALAPASSLGLFAGLGTNGSGSSVDWKMGGSILQCDYANVDWSLDRSALPPRPCWAVEGYSVDWSNMHGYDLFAMRGPVVSNRSGVMVRGLSEGVDSKDLSSVGSREWSSPFEEKDIFGLPRQFVSSPSL